MAVSFKNLGRQGRMANQLFQVAATIALALRNNDTYVFPPWQYEQYFNLHNCFSNNIPNTNVYKEPHFHYAPIQYRPNLELQGFYQSSKYWEDHEDEIKSLLTPKIGYGIKYGYTSIHVRRGDYVNQPHNYVPLGMDYYMKAIEITNSPNYIVVSDDIAWCKQNFVGAKFSFSEGKSAVEDLALQIACEKNIICNSSFSWWGGYLNKNPSKVVVAPAKWFNYGLPHNTKDLLPEEWIKT